MTCKTMLKRRRCRQAGLDCKKTDRHCSPLAVATKPFHFLDMPLDVALAFEAGGIHVAGLSEDWTFLPCHVVFAEDPSDTGV